MISKLIFLAILSLIFAVFDFYFYNRFLSFFTKNQTIKKAFLGAMAAWQFGFVALSITQAFWSIRPFFATVLGVLLFVTILGIALEIAKKFVYFEYLKYTLLAIFAIMFFYSFYAASLPPKVKYIQLATNSKTLIGLKVAVIADTHIDPSKREFAKNIVRQVNELNTDIILIVGDLCDGNIDSLKEALAPFGELKSRLGVYFVPGNHEYYYEDFDTKMEFLRTLNIKTLINESVNVADLSIVGLSDPAATRVGAEEPNPKKAFLGAQKTTILLAHQPKSAKEALQFHPDFVFCGHTHNGQIWPFNYLVSLAQPFVYGEYTDEASKIVVTSGAGVWGPPMRLFSHSEILVVSFF